MRALLAAAAAVSLVVTGLTTAAVPAHALPSERYQGPDRFATSVAISRATDAGSTVFLASGQKFPDALSAGPVVAAERGHLLLTTRDQLPAIVAERIRELQPSEIVVVGSEASVSAAVVAEAARISGAETITRIGGADRVETSLGLFERLLESGPVDTVWVASGFDFPDALVAASVAGRERAAVLLDHHAAGAAASEAWLSRMRPAIEGRDVRIAGGEPSVSALDAEGLARAAATVSRFAGSDRYQTARIINDEFAATPSEPTMLLATGSNFPDALAGAVHAALRGIPMYLTTGSCNTTISAMLAGEATRLGIARVIGLGSAATISDASLSLEPCPTLAQTIASQYGTFSPQLHSGGTGRLIDLGTGIPFARLRVWMSHTGTNRIVALDADREVLYEPIAIDGAYDGTSLLAAFHDQPVRYLRVDTAATWTVRVEDLASAPVLGASQRGSGDEVFIHDGPARTAQVSHGGGLLSVQELFDAGEGFGLPFDHCCEAFAGSAPLHAGPSIVAVVSDSPWSLELR